MRSGQATIVIRAARECIFDLIHDYDRRLKWDPFLRDAHLLDGAERAAAGVSSRCTARWLAGGMAMDTVYVTFNRPAVAAVKMTRGPRLFRAFAASIRHDVIDGFSTRVTYRYNFALRPNWLTWPTEPLANWMLHRETQQRLAALKTFLEGPEVV